MVSYTPSTMIGIEGGKQIGDKSINELVGATEEEFRHTYFHKMTR